MAPQILHLLFQASNSNDIRDFEWIKETINIASKTSTNLSPEQKNQFIELFKKYNTVEHIKQKCVAAVIDFWTVYYTKAIPPAEWLLFCDSIIQFFTPTI